MWDPESGQDCRPIRVSGKEVVGKAWCLWVENANEEVGEWDLSALASSSGEAGR